MKLKREHLVRCTIVSQSYRLFVIPLFLLFTIFVEGQVVSVVATDNQGAEVNAPGLPDPVSFTFSRTAVIAASTQVNYSVSGTSTHGIDYPLQTGSIIIEFSAAPQQAVLTISDIVDDNLVEIDETITVTITSLVGPGTISLTQNSATATISDDDEGTFSITTVDDDAAEETPLTAVGEAEFRIDLDKENATGTPVTLTYDLDGDDPGGNPDYNIIGGTVLSFPAGVTSRTLRLQPIDDTEVEDDEVVIITLEDPSSNLFDIGTPDSGTATIKDNDCLATTAPVLANPSPPTQLCDAASVNLNTYVQGGAPSAPAGTQLRWSLDDDPTDVSDLLPNSTATASDTYYGVYWANDNSCASPPLTVTLTFNTTPSSGTPVANIDEYCNNASNQFTPRSVDLDNLITGEAAGNWAAENSNPQPVAISGANVVNFDNVQEGTYEFTYTTTGAQGACSNASTTISIVVKDCDLCADIPAPQLNDMPSIFCGPIPDDVRLNDYAPNTSPAPGNLPLKWANNAADPLNSIVSASVELNPGPGTYHGFYLDTSSLCTTPPTVALTISTKPVPGVTSTNGEARCGPGAVTLTAVVSLNATINWFASETSTMILASGPNFNTNVSQTTTYWVEATLNDCPSERVAVVATVIPQPSAGIPQNGGNASACSDASNGPTILDLDDLIVGEDIGIWVFTSGPTGESVAVTSDNIIDFEGRADGDYVFTFTTTGAQAPCVNESLGHYDFDKRL